MPSFFRTIALNALLAGSILSHAAQAYPTENINDNTEIVGPNQPAHNNPSPFHPMTSPDLRIRVVDSFDEEEDGSELTRRATHEDKPKSNHKCPATKKYHEEKSYTSNQLYTAMMKGADLVKSNKHIGERMLLNLPSPLYSNSTQTDARFSGKYPHDFNNGEGIHFDCGSKLKEFPLMLSDPGKTYNGESVKEIPDRVVFEYREKKKGKAEIKFCGAMRHGDGGNKFVDCPAA